MIRFNHQSTEHEDKKSTRSLWRAVITQALIDAANNSKNKRARTHKIRALEWLTQDSQDFLEVCYMAEMEPEYVKLQVQGALNRGCKWRCDHRISKPIVLR